MSKIEGVITAEDTATTKEEKQPVCQQAGGVVEKTLPKQSVKSSPSALLIIVCLVISILSGMVSGWIFSRSNNRVVVIDLQKILNNKKNSIIAKYQNQEMNDLTKMNISKDTQEFLEKLKQEISKYSDTNLVLMKDSVVNDNVKDITDEIDKKVNGT